MTTSIPAAIDQIMTIAGNSLPAGFQVRFDSISGMNVGQQQLLLTGVRVTYDSYAELGPNYKHEEHFNVTSQLIGAIGNDDTIGLKNTIYGLYDDLAIAIATLPDLNGHVRLAWCRQLGYTPTHDANGKTLGVLDFEIEIQARVDSLD